MSQPTLSRTLNTFLDGMATLVNKYICFPDTMVAWNAVKFGFYELADMPNVMGAIDCMHVALVPLVADQYLFRHRNMGHCIKVQCVAGPSLRFFSALAGYPGSTRDAIILRNSSLFDRFESGELSDGWLLGDSAYPLLPWLMTPILRPQTPAHAAYNQAHAKTRAVVEQAIGLLKTRFRCLDHTVGALRYQPEKVIKIIVACMALHNFAIQEQIPHYVDVAPSAARMDVPSERCLGRQRILAQAVRNRLVSSHFS
ncbi:putative nuclease HARBI1 [Gastrophryne carolinensis]